MEANAVEAGKLLQNVQQASENAWKDMQTAALKALEQLQKGWAEAIGRFM
jgi:hypothetical protein